MLTDTFAFFLESADALVKFIETFLSARFAKAVGDVLESGLEAFAETSIDTLFFFFALLGIAIEPDLFVIRIINALDMHRRPGGGFDRDSGFGFELWGFGNNGTEIPVKLSSYTIKGQGTGYSESLAGSRRGHSSPFFTSSGIKKEYLPGIWM